MLGGFPNLNIVIRQWNPLLQMQALQTLASLGVCQMGQQGGLSILNGQKLKLVGQRVVASIPKPIVTLGTPTFVQLG
jgi:hypothetical protein